MSKDKKYLGHVNIINRSGYKPLLCHNLQELKKGEYHVVQGYVITGDAPKKFIRLYEYGKCRKSITSSWPLYIAKTGHKWYPGESITEYLLNILGNKFGLIMANSRLVKAGNQIRFLSRYFLNPKKQELVHGAEIFAGYLEDEKIIQEIEEQQKAREYFTVQFVHSALTKYCGTHTEQIFSQFIKMLLYDAWVGNNDRHYYNWGIIRHLQSVEDPCFAPVYDTARGLFWNIAEKKIISLHNNPIALKEFLDKYSKNSRPKTGFDGNANINHFQLIEYLYTNEVGISKEEFKTLISQSRLDSFLQCIDKDFTYLLSEKRRNVIKECLKHRYNTIQSLIK
jgi:HipA-like C-terminal domain